MNRAIKVYMCFLVLLSQELSVFAQLRSITVDDTSIRINAMGLDQRKDGQPVVVFESGHGTPQGNWDRVIHEVSRLAPVVAYDRPGVGESEAVDEEPTMENVSARLINLLDQLELPPPYLLVGHSLGGLYVRGFAIHHPELLAGLVIIDPADFTENHQNRRAYYDVLDWKSSRVDSLIDSFIQRRNHRHEKSPPPIRREGQYLEKVREQEFQEIVSNPLPNVPVHIITGGRFDSSKHPKTYDEEAVFRAKMRQRVSRWTDVIQSVDHGVLLYSGSAGHFVQWDDPELVISSIKIALQDYAAMNN
ncbi:MAG: alpha/beta hydrolase [Bacteroidota bacterium]